MGYKCVHYAFPHVALTHGPSNGTSEKLQYQVSQLDSKFSISEKHFREEARLGTFNLWDYIYDIWTRHYSSHISSYWSSSDYSSVVNQWLGATQKVEDI